MSTQVKDFMTKPVISCKLPNDVGTVRDLMKQKECHAIPLVEIGGQKQIEIRGIVTSEDLMGVYDDTVDVQQVMTKKVQVVHPDSSAQAAAKMMLQQHTHHLIVMDEGHIVGMLSSLDFVELVAKQGI